MFRRPRQLQLQAEHSREQIIRVKVKGVKLLHAFVARLAVMQERRWCDPIQGTSWYVGALRPGGIPALLPCTHLHTQQNSGLHSATGALLPALTSPTQGCFCSHWALGALCKHLIPPHVYWVWAQADQLLPSSSSLMIKIFTAQWAGLAAAPKLCSW